MRPCVLVLPCLMILLATPVTAASVSLRSNGDAASVILGMAEELMGVDLRLAHDLLADRAERPLALVLHHAPDTTVASALAHALDTWYVPLSDNGGYLFTRASVLPTVGPVDVRTIPTRMSEARQARDIVADLLAPWLGEQCGFAFHPFQGRWVATLDSVGHARFRQLITTLEQPEPHIPILTQPAAPQGTIASDILATTWFELAEQIAMAGGCSVSIAHGLGDKRLDPPLRLAANRSLADLPLALASHDIHGLWQDRLLLLDTLRKQRNSGRHPALRRLLAVVPIAQFADQGDISRLLYDLRHHVLEHVWRLPGYGLYHLSAAESILIAADRATINSLLNLLERHEHKTP